MSSRIPPIAFGLLWANKYIYKQKEEEEIFKSICFKIYTSKKKPEVPHTRRWQANNNNNKQMMNRKQKRQWIFEASMNTHWTTWEGNE